MSSMRSNPWDERFAGNDFIYGTEPNEFFKHNVQQMNFVGKALFPAEGEGRNAVFAATLGWDVVAYDGSSVAKRKALSLAFQKEVSIQYFTSFHEEFEHAKEAFDLAVLIFAHAPNRKQYHQKMLSFLKPGATILLEGFSKEQLNYRSGGPSNYDLLFSEEELRDDFSTLQELKIEKSLVRLDEGSHHQGIASVIRLVGKK
ncbi:MAG: class I SAM-dependent methyltransferase [Bacteroidales bacterium]|nr:class I SAM-dependent methyltransferase [Bacteroidales bacterium]